MTDDPKSKPSFSPAGRWRIGFDVVARTVLVLAVLGMVNYLGTRFHHRFYLSSQTRAVLSSRTLAVLRSVTNHVDVTLYYDTRDPHNFYADVASLLNEYRDANRNISVQTVDYVLDLSGAEQLKAKFPQYFTSQSDKDLVIFNSAGRVRVFPGSELVSSKDDFAGMEPDPHNPKKQVMAFDRRPVTFNGERAFTSILLALASPQKLTAYFLQGSGEGQLADTGNFGFQKFATVLAQNYISVTNLEWAGNGVPMDCGLLIIAGPTEHLKEPELQQISQYLHEGGKLLMLFNLYSQGHPTGLEDIMQTWGVGVMDDIAQDADNTVTTHDIVVNPSQFGRHPVMDSLSDVQLQLYSPRPIWPLPAIQSANAPEVTALFGTSPDGTLVVHASESPHSIPLACAVEQKPVAGLVNPRGNTRMIVVGDDIFLGNYYIDSPGNRDFLNAAVNWLCDRDTLVGGIEPRPVTNFHLQITRRQQRQLGWLLLGALPGGVLAFGCLVWLVRRK